MKKILIGILVAVAVLAACGFVLSQIAEHKLHKLLAEDIPGAQIDFRKASLSPILGNLEFRDIKISFCDSTGTLPQVQGSIDAIRLENLRWRSFAQGEARAKRLVIRGPKARLVLPENTAEKESEEVDEDSTAFESSFLKKVSLSEIKVENAAIDLRSQTDSLKVNVQNMGFSVHDINVLLAENTVEYNDSCYSFSLDSLFYADAPGLSCIKVGHLATRDAGPVEGLGIHLYNCVPMETVAERMGKVTAVWYDVNLDSLCTSPINIPRMAKAERVDVESIRVSSPGIVLFQDNRYPPAVPYTTMQEGLNAVELPLHIGQVEVNVKKFNFIMETTHINRGSIAMDDLHVAIKSISNAPNNVMGLSVRYGNKKTGTMNLAVNIHNDKHETTTGELHVRGLDASRMDNFIRPLFGATARADIHQIDGTFKGNKDEMTEEFCMQYENLSIQAWNDETAPFKIMAKNSGAVTFLANLVLPSANPSKPGKEPKSVQVSFKRDVMQPYPAYLVQNLTMGMLRTVLPGGSIKKDNKK